MSRKEDKKVPIGTEDVKEGVEKSVKGARKLLQEFKDFAMRGNMIDMAVGIVLGSAFTGMVDSIVKGLLNPLVAIFTKQTGSTNWVINGFNIGSVLDAIVHFIIVAAVIFAVVKGMNALANIKKTQDESEKAEGLVTELEVLEEIRDLLKENKKGE